MEADLRLTGVDLLGGLVHREPYLVVLAVSQNTERGAQPTIYPLREAPLPEPKEGEEAVPVEILRHVGLDVPVFEGDPGDWLVLSLMVVDSSRGVDYAVRRVDESRHAWDRTHFAGILGTPQAVAGNAVLPAMDDAMGMLADTFANHGDVVMARFSLNLSGTEAFQAFAPKRTTTDGAEFVFDLVVEGLPEPEPKRVAGGIPSGGDPAAKPAPPTTETHGETANPGNASPPAAVTPGATAATPPLDQKAPEATAQANPQPQPIATANALSTHPDPDAAAHGMTPERAKQIGDERRKQGAAPVEKPVDKKDL